MLHLFNKLIIKKTITWNLDYKYFEKLYKITKNCDAIIFLIFSCLEFHVKKSHISHKEEAQ